MSDDDLTGLDSERVYLSSDPDLDLDDLEPDYEETCIPDDEEPDDEPTCPVCMGSGEGLHDGALCFHCKGRGSC